MNELLFYPRVNRVIIMQFTNNKQFFVSYSGKAFKRKFRRSSWLAMGR